VVIWCFCSFVRKFRAVWGSWWMEVEGKAAVVGEREMWV